MNWVRLSMFVLCCLGAINWGLVALFNLDLVREVSNGMRGLEKGLYVAIAFSGLYVLVRKTLKICGVIKRKK